MKINTMHATHAQQIFTQQVITANDSASQKFVTVRQIFSAGPAVKIQASLQLRRSSLSQSAAAWPCWKLLLCTAPLSSDLIFCYFNTVSILSQCFFAFIVVCNKFPLFLTSFCIIYTNGLKCKKRPPISRWSMDRVNLWDVSGKCNTKKRPI